MLRAPRARAVDAGLDPPAERDGEEDRRERERETEQQEVPVLERDVRAQLERGDDQNGASRLKPLKTPMSALVPGWLPVNGGVGSRRSDAHCGAAVSIDAPAVLRSDLNA